MYFTYNEKWLINYRLYLIREIVWQIHGGKYKAKETKKVGENRMKKDCRNNTMCLGLWYYKVAMMMRTDGNE